METAMRAAIAAAIATVAPALHLDADLVTAVSYRELIDGKLVSATNADGSRDWGALQVNGAVWRLCQRQWGGRWANVTPQDLVDDPELGVEAGCRILRWRVFEALTAEGIAVPRSYGRPNYEAMSKIVAGLKPQARRGVYYRAVAAYRGGDVAMRDWPNVDPVTVIYTGLVLREYERLTE